MRRATASGNTITEQTLLITTQELPEYLHCGRQSAVTLGRLAGAEIRLGRRQLWNVPKIRAYINEISE